MDLSRSREHIQQQVELIQMNMKSMMSKTLTILGAVCVVTGCATETQLLDAGQGLAIQTAVARGKFELNCPSAQGEVISREVIQPPVEGTYAMSIARDEYTVGVKGCGKRTSYVVICPQGGNGCFAAAPGEVVSDG
jgi:hypothetical protein